MNDAIIQINKSQIDALKQEAQLSPRRRARICLHQTANDLIHEMIIAICKDSYVVPHRHRDKSESFHIIEGEAMVIIFSDNGDIAETIKMGEYQTGLTNTYRLNKSFWHSVIPLSEILILKEVTSGPFIKADSLFAPWAPSETDIDAAKNFMKNLLKQIFKIEYVG